MTSAGETWQLQSSMLFQEHVSWCHCGPHTTTRVGKIESRTRLRVRRVLSGRRCARKRTSRPDKVCPCSHCLSSGDGSESTGSKDREAQQPGANEKMDGG